MADADAVLRPLSYVPDERYGTERTRFSSCDRSGGCLGCGRCWIVRGIRGRPAPSEITVTCAKRKSRRKATSPGGIVIHAGNVNSLVQPHGGSAGQIILQETGVCAQRTQTPDDCSTSGAERAHLQAEALNATRRTAKRPTTTEPDGRIRCRRCTKGLWLWMGPWSCRPRQW